MEKKKKIKDYPIIANLGRTSYGTIFEVAKNSGKSLVCHQIMTNKFTDAQLRLISIMIEESKKFKHENIWNIVLFHVESNMWNALYDAFTEKTLDKLLLKHKLTLENAVQVIKQLREVIRYFHQKGISHYFFRLKNVLVIPESLAIKVVDPLIPKLVSFHQKVEDMDEYKYWPPELLNGEKETELSDVWSLGLMCWQIVFGRDSFPFDLGSKERFLESVFEPVNVPDCGDSQLTNLIEGALITNPDERFTPEQFYNHPFFTGSVKNQIYIEEPGDGSERKILHLPKTTVLLESLRRNKVMQEQISDDVVSYSDFYSDRIFELQIIKRTIDGFLTMITHNWNKELVMYFRGFMLCILNRALLHAENLSKSLREEKNFYKLFDFDLLLENKSNMTLIRSELHEIYTQLKNLDDSIFLKLQQDPYSKDYSDEIRHNIYQHLADSEEYKAFVKATHKYLRTNYKMGVEEEQITEMKKEISKGEIILAGRILENIEEF